MKVRKLFNLSAVALGISCWASPDILAQSAAPEPSPVAYGDKVFRPGAVWTDDNGTPINAHGAGILYHGGTFYWFGEHKTGGRGGNKAQVGVHVYSSRDLYSWHDEGIALAVSQDPNSDIAKGCILERPKVIYNSRTGKFVMWFHLERKGKGYGDARSGVAVADNATGPYKYLASYLPNSGVWPDNFPLDEREPLSPGDEAQLKQLQTTKNGKKDPRFPDLVVRRDFAGGQMARDMTLFVDDDQKAYLIYASEENSTMEISQLSDDYLGFAGHYIRILPGGYNEAPAMFKHGGKYFLITSGQHGWSPCDARLTVADSVLGVWTSLGNPCHGTPEQQKTTFTSQSAYILPVPGMPGGFIFMADRWRPDNAIDGRYIWLPIQWDNGTPFLEWKDSWNLGAFSSRSL